MGERDERIRQTPEEIRKLREGVLRLIAYTTVGLGTPMVVAISLSELSAGRFDAVFGALLAAQVAFTAAVFLWREPRARAIALIVYLWIIGSAALLHAGPGVTAGFAYLSAALIACIHVHLRASWIVLGAAAVAFAGAAALSLSGGVPGFAAELYDLSRPSNWLRLGGVSILFMACIVATFGMAMRRLERVALEAQAALEEARRARDERRSAELAFIEAQRHEIISRIASGAAHDLNNVLTVVRGAADMASVPSRDPRRVAEELTLIKDGVRRASTLTRQLLSFGRRHEPPARQRVDVSGVLLGLQGILERLTPPDVELAIEAPEGLPCISADSSQLEQIILNLCVNARDAMPDGGRLGVRASADRADDGERVAISVSDTGTGIPEDVRARMFEPFFTTKPDGEGTGLGLATVRLLVEAHGGTILCETRVGEGTTMRVSFPPADVAERETLESGRLTPLSVPIGGREPILVCDRDDMSRRMTARILEDAGYSVEAVADCGAAKGAAARRSFALAIVDAEAPDFSPSELGASTRLLCTTGIDPAAVGMRPRQAILLKPFGRADLLLAVRRALDGDPEPR